MTTTQYVSDCEKRLTDEMRKWLEKTRKKHILIKRRMQTTDKRERQALRVQINSIERSIKS